MQCPECGNNVNGVDHNKRGLRCEWCWARLPAVQPEPEPKQTPKLKPEPKAKPKAARPKG